MDRPDTVPLYVQRFAHFWRRHSTELILTTIGANSLIYEVL